MTLLSKTLLTVMFSLSAATVSAQTMRIATDSGAQGSPSGDAIEKWAALIKEGTQGALSPRVFYQNQLGGQEEVFDQHVAGDVQLMLNWPMTSYDKRIAVIYTPYMFTTWEQALAAYQAGGWLNETFGRCVQGKWPEVFWGLA